MGDSGDFAWVICRGYNTKVNILYVVARDPEVMGGALCFKGTRVQVETLFSYLRQGHDIDYFLAGYEWVPRESVEAVLQFSYERLEEQIVSHKAV